MTGNQTTEPTGAQLRDAGIDAVLAADVAVHRGFRKVIDAALDELIASGAEFSADDLQLRLDDTTRASAAPNLVSAAIALASRQGRIRHVGWGTSTRPARHCGVQRRWVGAASPPHAA